VAGGLPISHTTIQLDELKAIDMAIDMAAPDDLVVALVYRIPQAWAALSNRAQPVLRV
jgi:hypothetical protein